MSCSKTATNSNNNTGTGGTTGGNNGGTQNSGYLVHVSSFVLYDTTGAVTEKNQTSYSYDKPNNVITTTTYDTTSAGAQTITSTCSLVGSVITIKPSIAAYYYKYYLNLADSSVDSLYLYNLTGGYNNALVYSYTHDASGQLTSETTTSKIYKNDTLQNGATTATTNFTWQAGNNITEQTGSYTYTFTYYSNLAPMPDLFTFISSPSAKGYQNKNMLQSESLIQPNGAGYYIYLSYTYDSQGRPLTATGTDKKGRTTQVTTYTYY